MTEMLSQWEEKAKKCGENRVLEVVDRLCAVFLAMSPLLQHYKGPLHNAGISVLVLFVPYLLFRMFEKRKNIQAKQWLPILVLVVYYLYRVGNHGTTITELGQSGVLIIYLMAMALGCIPMGCFTKTMVSVSVVATLCLMLQYVSFYLFRYHIQMVPTDLLIDSADQWILGAQMGLAGITGKIRDWYRPSAFFLEPSHVYLYLFPSLLTQLLTPKKAWKDYTIAVLVTLGLILSTSGMGVGAVAGAWGLFVALYNEETGTFELKNVMRKRNRRCIGALMVICVVMCVAVPPIRRTVTRIFVAPSGSNAIAGRVARAWELLAKFDTRQWCLGVADTIRGITFNMPGFADIIYRHGIIGMLLSYTFYVKGVFRSSFAYGMTAAVIIVTSFFSAHTHSTIGMLYYVTILMAGYDLAPRKRGK